MVGFDAESVTVSEAGGDIMVPVTVAQEIATTVTVGVEVVSGTAVEGEGQSSLAQLFNIAAGSLRHN